MSLYANLPVAPPDAILNTATAFKADTSPNKVNLGIGAYRTEEGKPYILPVVRKIEEELLAELGGTINKEYLGIDGLPSLKNATQKLFFGQADERIASLQALSGTGSLRVIADFVKKHLPASAHTVYQSSPTWGNHKQIFENAGMKVETYPYWDAEKRNLDFAGMIGAIKAMPEGACVLIHACAHNPTGVDPTEAQWFEIVNVIKEKKLLAILDSAYQGYATGDLERDRFAAVQFYQSGIEFFAAQSFAKNLGMYGERIGMVHFITAAKENAEAVLSQAKLVVRGMYSSPPLHGAHIVDRVLNNPTYYEQWKVELKEMADRILEVRALLRKGLEEKGTPGTWNHITEQIGMFSFTGLTPPQCEKLISEHHVYLLKSGRISLAGLNKGNVQYFINAMDDVVRTA